MLILLCTRIQKKVFVICGQSDKFLTVVDKYKTLCENKITWDSNSSLPPAPRVECQLWSGNLETTEPKMFGRRRTRSEGRLKWNKCRNRGSHETRRAKRRSRYNECSTSSESESEHDWSGDGDDDDDVSIVNRLPRQCRWSECVKASRSESKYCSDECGIKTATEILLKVVPERLQQWNSTSSIAQQKYKQKCEEIRSKLAECVSTLAELEKNRNTLDAHIAHVKEKDIDPDSLDIQEEWDVEGSISCVTCGHEVSIKTCVRHMERCYNKYERRRLMESPFKADLLNGTPFLCEFYIDSRGMYCKNLKVLCPQHSKESKPREAEVCGFPLVDTATGPTDQICKLSKKICKSHYSWEKLRRAEIDIKKLNAVKKYNGLYIEEQKTNQALNSKPGILDLLLTSSYDHEAKANK